MNIFYLHTDPQLAAEFQCDVHVVKMPLESAQMLCTVAHMLGFNHLIPGCYKPTHRNHPCVQWAASRRANYDWLVRHAIWLCVEYKRRYKRTHRSSWVVAEASLHREKLPGGSFTPPPQCMPAQYQVSIVPAEPLNPWGYPRGYPRGYPLQPPPGTLMQFALEATVQAYRMYYREEKGKLAVYSRSQRPEFMHGEQVSLSAAALAVDSGLINAVDLTAELLEHGADPDSEMKLIMDTAEEPLRRVTTWQRGERP